MNPSFGSVYGLYLAVGPRRLSAGPSGVRQHPATLSDFCPNYQALTGSKGNFAKETIMPFVNIKITNENVTKAQKEQLIEGATKLLADVLGKNPATTVVVIEEIDTDNWGIGGECVTARRKRHGC
jgi:4-oxalocrotonate tautomerase